MKAPHIGRHAPTPLQQVGSFHGPKSARGGSFKNEIAGPASAKESGKRHSQILGSLKVWVRSTHSSDAGGDRVRRGSETSGGDHVRRGSETSRGSTATNEDRDASWESAHGGRKKVEYFSDASAYSGTTAPDPNRSSSSTAPAAVATHVVVAREGPRVLKVESRADRGEEVPPDEVVFFGEDALGMGLPPRTASEVSQYWKKVEAKQTAERASMGLYESPPPSFGRPETFIDDVPPAANYAKTKVLEVRNSELEDRVAELERKLAAMTAAQPP